jgi:hypothetical protein
MVMAHVAAQAREGGLFVLLVPLAIGHSLAAAFWLRGAGRGRRLTYRLLVLLITASVTLFVILSLFLPMIGLIDSLGGATTPKK